MAFYVGQKVVCVDAGIGKLSMRKANLEEGAVYTISKVIDWFGHVGLHLVEAKPLPGYSGFAAERFRPIVERKTDISIFKAMLNHSKQEVGA